MLNITNQADKVSVVAIEEPESHLHPGSARQLYQTVSALSENHQVILTTHSPLFVNRTNLRENIIVHGGKATPVKRIKEIREVLGINVSDNLINAENILVVEGESDKIILDKLLPHMSDIIKRAIQNGSLVIDYIGGAGNLSYKLAFYRSIQCNYHVLLDNDIAGRQAGQNAETQGLLTTKNVTYAQCKGSKDSEMEDCFNPSVYKQIIQDKFGVSLNNKEFKCNKKWSERIANCFKTQGKQWGDAVEKKVKLSVAEAIINSDPIKALNSVKRSSIDAFSKCS